MPRSQVEAKPTLPPASCRPRKLPLKFVVALVLIAAMMWAIILLLKRAGSFLVIHAPERSDVMIVLEGGTGSSRFAQALRLQKKGYAPLILVDADVARNFYGQTEADLIRNYLRQANLDNVEICPTTADSTYAEAADIERCMKRVRAGSAIIVTSDFHTRRALSIFRKRLPQYQWSVAASSWPANAAEQYWRHRWWAKTVIDEWEKYLWWQLVDRWRSGVVLQ